MNGLPRHVSQADDVDRIVNISNVIRLKCDAGTVCARIRLNSGGDRADRPDDSEEDIARKLEIFDRRTRPVLDHYRAKGVEIREFEVGVNTVPDEILLELEA